MSNGAECCAIGVCCPPDSQSRVDALAKIINDTAASDGRMTAEDAAACVLEHFDLANKGTLQPLLDDIAKMARHAAQKDAST